LAAVTVCSVDIDNGNYDERDIERVRTNDEYLKCFIRSFYENGDMNAPLEKLDTVLTFRKKICLNGKTTQLWCQLNLVWIILAWLSDHLAERCFHVVNSQ